MNATRVYPYFLAAVALALWALIAATMPASPSQARQDRMAQVTPTVGVTTTATITPTLTATATLTPTGTITATLVPTPTPTGTPAPCQLEALWYVGEGRVVSAFRRPAAEPLATYAWSWTITGEFGGGVPLACGEDWLFDVPGATATLWQAETPAPTATDAPPATCIPVVQTVEVEVTRIVIVVVTATTRPTPTPRPSRLWVPVAVKRR